MFFCESVKDGIKDDFEFIEKNYVLIYEDNQVYEKYQVHFYLFKLRN